VRELRREAKYLQGAYDALLTAGRGLPPQQAAAVRLEGAAELGRLDVLRACLAELGQPNWTTLLTASIAAELAGDGEWAAALRVRAAGAALGDASADPRVAKLLREPASADLDTAADVDGEPIQKAVWLVALLQAGAPQDLAALARTLNYQPFFPHDLLDRALRKLGDGPS